MKIYYDKTEIEVVLGDTVWVKGLLWGKIPGAISYVPGVSPRHNELERSDNSHVGIKIKNNTVLGFPIFKNQKYLSKRIVLISKSESNFQGIQAHTILK